MQVNTAELKAQLSRYLKMVREGKTIDVTSHSHPVAKIIPHGDIDTPEVIQPTRKIEDLKSITGIHRKKSVDAVQTLLDDRNNR